MTSDISSDLDQIYGRRFSEAEAANKHAMWREICRYLQQHVGPHSTVLDIACDRGYFIENIIADDRWAADMRDVSQYLSDRIHFVQADGLSLDEVLPRESFDVIFMSNYLEHLPSGDAVVEQMRVARRLLKSGGRMIVLQPNVSLLAGAYWDFIDHKVALNERSLVEAAALADLHTVKLIKRFLPYTTKGVLPVKPALVRAYLALRPVWFVLGRQTLLIAERRG